MTIKLETWNCAQQNCIIRFFIYTALSPKYASKIAFLKSSVAHNIKHSYQKISQNQYINDSNKDIFKK